MDRLVWICAGGAVGSGARYLLSVWALRQFGAAFPYGTLLVNAIGSFALGALMHWALGADASSAPVRLGLTTGLLGGFTTFSTFSYETARLLREGALVLGALNIALSLGGCLLATVAGLWVGRWFGAG